MAAIDQCRHVQRICGIVLGHGHVASLGKDMMPRTLLSAPHGFLMAIRVIGLGGVWARRRAAATPPPDAQGQGSPKSCLALSRPILRRSASLISQVSNQAAASA